MVTARVVEGRDYQLGQKVSPLQKYTFSLAIFVLTWCKIGALPVTEPKPLRFEGN